MNGQNPHLDEMTGLLYVEGQLDRTRAQEVSTHADGCAACRTLLRALERESRLLTRAMFEEEEPLPARLTFLPGRSSRSWQWVWAATFGLAATGVYALYTGYIEPWMQQLEQVGFGGTNLLGLLIFRGAFWKGWQSMLTLIEMLAMLTLAGFAVAFLRRRWRRGSVLAMVLAALCAFAALPAPASATEFRKGNMVEVAKNETVKGDLYVSCGRSRIDGTVDGDLYFFGQSLDVSGHVMGDVIVFAQSARISGHVDGNIRSFVNTLTIAGNVGKNITTFNEVTNVDSGGKVGGSLTAFANTLGIDGRLGRDLLLFANQASISGTIGGGVRAKGNTLTIASTAQIGGPARFDGEKPPDVSPQAKLASPVEYHVYKPHREFRTGRYYFWQVIFTAAVLLFGLVLFRLMPRFAADSVAAGERYGASLGLGVLVFFAVPIAAIVACITVVGLAVGISACVLWIATLYTSQLVVGALVGRWILGPTLDVWPLIGRMTLGFVLIRLIVTVPHVGGWIKLGVILWGMGAISLALYRRFQPVLPAPPAAAAFGSAQAA